MRKLTLLSNTKERHRQASTLAHVRKRLGSRGSTLQHPHAVTQIAPDRCCCQNPSPLLRPLLSAPRSACSNTLVATDATCPSHQRTQAAGRHPTSRIIPPPVAPASAEADLRGPFRPTLGRPPEESHRLQVSGQQASYFIRWLQKSEREEKKTEPNLIRATSFGPPRP